VPRAPQLGCRSVWLWLGRARPRAREANPARRLGHALAGQAARSAPGGALEEALDRQGIDAIDAFQRQRQERGRFRLNGPRQAEGCTRQEMPDQIDRISAWRELHAGHSRFAYKRISSGTAGLT
jgi:hypothetical protein